MNARFLDLSKLSVRPLTERLSLTSVDEVLVHPDTAPPGFPAGAEAAVTSAAGAICRARAGGAAVVLMYGAHLVRNGAALILGEMMRRGWLTHIATNGAGTIHDWEFAWLGRSTEIVAENVARGRFGTWDETGRYIHLALLSGGCRGEGYGLALGRFIAEDGVMLPSQSDLHTSIREEPDHQLTAPRVELLRAMRQHNFQPGPHPVVHRWKSASILGTAFAHKVGASIHPGIGYDIISCHPMFNGAVIGRASELDFKLFAGAVDQLDGGVVLSIGSAIMAPQVFEKALSCVHNLRFQEGRPAVTGLDIFVVDLQDGGNWDWTQGEPPKDNPAYYLRFCKSFSRMGGSMRYVQCDNVAFVHNLLHELRRRDP